MRRRMDAYRAGCSALRSHPAAETECVVAYLTDALVELGHDVTLFARADARTKARLIPMRDQAIRLDPYPLKSDVAAHLAMLYEVRRIFEERPERTLTTLHAGLDLRCAAPPDAGAQLDRKARRPVRVATPAECARRAHSAPLPRLLRSADLRRGLAEMCGASGECNHAPALPEGVPGASIASLARAVLVALHDVVPVDRFAGLLVDALVADGREVTSAIAYAAQSREPTCAVAHGWCN